MKENTEYNVWMHKDFYTMLQSMPNYEEHVLSVNYNQKHVFLVGNFSIHTFMG